MRARRSRRSRPSSSNVSPSAVSCASTIQPLDFLGTAGLLARRRLAPPPGVGGAREHAVFGGDPALALAAQPGRQARLDGSRAQDPGIAEADEAGALGVTGKARL